MNGLPSSLRIAGGEDLSYSPYGQRFSPGQYLRGILELVEIARQRRQTKSLIENILGTTKADTEGIASVIGTPTETIALPPAYAGIAPKITETLPSPEAPKRGLLSKIGTAIGGLFDVSRPPREIVPLKQTIAEAMLKAKLEPREWKPRTWGERKEEIETEARAKAKAQKLDIKVIGNKLYERDPETGNWALKISGEQGIKGMTDEELLNYYVKFTPGGLEPDIGENPVFDTVKDELVTRNLYPAPPPPEIQAIIDNARKKGASEADIERYLKEKGY